MVCTVSIIITRVCEAIWECLWQKYLPTPTQHDWSRIETGFRLRWDYPNCVGAIDGKHIAIRAPPGSASLYFNYKNHFSIILMAAVDAGYQFIVVDVGNYRSNSDTGIFKHSNFGQKFLLKELGLPPRKPLPGFPEAGLLPHCFVGDEAFPLSVDLMRPYLRGHERHKALRRPTCVQLPFKPCQKNCGVCIWYFSTTLQSFRPKNVSQC